MEDSRIQDILRDQWKVAVSACRNAQEREDLRQVIDYASWDDLQALVAQGPSNHPAFPELANLSSGLLKLRTFVDDWLPRVSPQIDTSPVLGFARLIIKLLLENPSARPHVLPMLREVFHKIGLLHNYFDETETFTTELKESCVEFATSLLNFFSYIVSFTRRDMPAENSQSETEWLPLEREYTSAGNDMEHILTRIEKLSKRATRSAGSEERLGKDKAAATPTDLAKQLRNSSLSDEEAKLPCIILPSIRTSRFFDRVDIIKDIENHFHKIKPEDSFQSLAIHGLGGVGKSTVALRYAEHKLQRDELDALFWVHSEKLVSIKQSFTNMAIRLKLPDAREGDHEENQALMLNWLQRTRCRWLIVYDNAEDPDLIREFWPLSTRGQAIITTRNLRFGLELADLGMEVTNWDNENGLRFLLSLLSSDISNELQGEEGTSAQLLSEKLRGHALAISTMAGLIHRRAMSITEFMRFYDEHPSDVHGVSGNRSINTLWELSFKSLSPESSAILGVMSYVEPESIPQALFEPASADSLPPSLAFCSDRIRKFPAAIEELLTQALIKRDKVSRCFSLHRLVQSTFKSFMTPEQRQSAFSDATILVSESFPRRDSDLAQLYLMWERCALFLQHVISLKDCFREEIQANPSFSASQTYCDLNNRCQRYLLELNSYEDLEDLAKVNSLAMSTLPEEEQIVSLQGSLTSHRGQLLVRLGKGVEGVEWLKKSYEIRSHDVPFHPRESAWAADNAATGIATLNKFEEAMEWYEKARDHFLEWSNTQTQGKGEWPAVLKTSMGRGLFWSGNVSEARALTLKSLKQVESAEPFNWALAATTYFALGTIERHDRKYELAESYFMEAQNLWLKGDQMRSDPFYGACLYRLGCTSLDKGQVEAAIKHLRDALVVTEKRKHNMVAEHMRCLFKLSEALEQEPRGAKEADKLRTEAEHLLLQREPGAGDAGKESTYDNLVCLSWR